MRHPIESFPTNPAPQELSETKVERESADFERVCADILEDLKISVRNPEKVEQELKAVFDLFIRMSDCPMEEDGSRLPSSGALEAMRDFLMRSEFAKEWRSQDDDEEDETSGIPFFDIVDSILKEKEAIDEGDLFILKEQFLPRIMSKWDKAISKIKKHPSESGQNFLRGIVERSWDSHGGEENANEAIHLGAEAGYRQDELVGGIESSVHSTAYALKSVIVEHLVYKGESKEGVEEIMRYIGADPMWAARHRSGVARMLSSLDPEYAQVCLMDVRKRAKPLTSSYEIATNILRRLELGALPITNEGIVHQGNVYDLGDLNDERYHGRKITADGKVGIFDPQEGLLKYFETADPESGKRMKAVLRELTYDDLFYPEAGLDEEEAQRRKGALELIVKHFESVFQSKFMDETGMYFSELNLRQQGAFILAWMECGGDEERKRYLSRFLLAHKEAGASALIACEEPDFSLDDITRLQYAIDPNAEVFEKTGRPLDRLWSFHHGAELWNDYHETIVFAQRCYDAVAPALEAAFRKKGKKFDGRSWFSGMVKRSNDVLRLAHRMSFSDADGKDIRHFSYQDLVRFIRDDFSHLTITSCREGILQSIATDLANTFQAEEVRVVLSKAGSYGAQIQKYLSPEIPGEVVEDLRKLYADIHFEEYALNAEMLEQDLSIIRSRVPEGASVCDLGCGTGRISIPLAQDGKYRVDAIDLSERHVDIVQEKLGKEHVTQGDWTKTPYEDDSFEAVVSLGRNILHETSIDRQRALFAEANRILKEGGRLIIDIPDRDLAGSYYQQMVSAYADEMAKRNIRNIRQGAIVDSPDGKHFATRYVYGREDITTLALEAGFEIEAIEHRDLPTGNHADDEESQMTDTNIYYILKKVTQKEAYEFAQAA